MLNEMEKHPDLKKTIRKEGQAPMLYCYYPVPDGCPECGQAMFIGYDAITKVTMSQENKMLATCPGCGCGLEMQIGKMKKGKFVPADFNYVIPDGDMIRAQKAEGIVLTIPKDVKNEA